MQLTHLKQKSKVLIQLTWDDGHESPISLKSLRDECPCAGCKGESVLFQTYVPPFPDTETPGRYQLSGAEPIGGYALKFSWGDGHNLGLYTWEHLRSLCECDACLKASLPSSN